MWGFCTVLGWKYVFLSHFLRTSKWVWIKKYLVDASWFWRTKIVSFTSFKDQFNPRKWKKSLKVQNFEVVNSAICAVFTLCHCKNLAAECWGDFPPEKFYFEVFSKPNAASITFGLRYIHGQSKGNWFSDPKRSGPVLGRRDVEVHFPPWSFLFIKYPPRYLVMLMLKLEGAI